MTKPTDAKSKLIRTAAALFRQRGYNGVGLNELLAAANAPKGSFYYHFPGGKEQLAEAAVRYAGAAIARLTDDCFDAAPDFPTGLTAFLTMVADWHATTGFREGCPITSVLLDTVPQSDLISKAVLDVFGDWEARMVRHAHRLGLVSFNAADGARLLMLIEGAWILARAHRSREPMLNAGRFFLASLGRQGG